MTDRHANNSKSAAPRPSRIGIDARFYGPIGKGLGRYTQEIVDKIIELDPKNEYVIFLCRENFDDLNLHNRPRAKKVMADIRWYGFKEQWLLPLYLWREKLDLVHFPHFNVPLLCPVKFVVTIHDLILLKFPTRRASTLSPLAYALKNFIYKIVIWTAAKRARRVITVSSYTKKDVVSQFKISPDKVAVTYEGIAGFNPGTESLPAEVLLKYGISKPYIIYVGNAYPHKNLEGLIKVFAELNRERPDLSLVLVGKEDYFYQRLKNSAQAHGGRVVFPGYVPDNDLAALYRQARLYVFPSFFEGFGLPALEAMSFGLPVASSNRTCLPEILGEAALYFNPDNGPEMKAALLRLIDDESLRQELVIRGFAKIKNFSWRDCAEKTLEIYLNILGKNKT